MVPAVAPTGGVGSLHNIVELDAKATLVSATVHRPQNRPMPFPLLIKGARRQPALPKPTPPIQRLPFRSIIPAHLTVVAAVKTATAVLGSLVVHAAAQRDGVVHPSYTALLHKVVSLAMVNVESYTPGMKFTIIRPTTRCLHLTLVFPLIQRPLTPLIHRRMCRNRHRPTEQKERKRRNQASFLATTPKVQRSAAIELLPTAVLTTWKATSSFLTLWFR